mgnify:CR=1 FL=1
MNFGFIRGPVLYGFFFLQPRLRRHAVAEHIEEAQGFEGTVGGMAAAEGVASTILMIFFEYVFLIFKHRILIYSFPQMEIR